MLTGMQIEKRSIDYVPIAERHGKVWHQLSRGDQAVDFSMKLDLVRPVHHWSET
jgi:hypothetical protein